MASVSPRTTSWAVAYSEDFCVRLVAVPTKGVFRLSDTWNTECDLQPRKILFGTFLVIDVLFMCWYTGALSPRLSFLCQGRRGLFPSRWNFNRVTYFCGSQGTHDGLKLGFNLLGSPCTLYRTPSFRVPQT